MSITKKLKSRSSAPKIRPVSEIESSLAALFYGKSGTGKTTLSSSFPKPLLLLDIRERGTGSISNVPQVFISEITAWNELEEVYWYLKSNPGKYQTVVLDQVTQMQSLALDKVRAEAGKEIDEAMSRQLWGRVSGLMTTWLMNFRDLIDLGVNVVFLAHDRMTESDEETDTGQIDPSVGPRMMPSIASFLTGAVGVIGNTFIRERYQVVNKRKVRSVEYVMRLGPHAYYLTKTRTPVGIESPDVLVDPTYDKLVAVIRGETSSNQLKRKVK